MFNRVSVSPPGPPTQQLENLRRIVTTILDRDLPAHTLRPEVLELSEILSAASGSAFSRKADIASGESRTRGGFAVSPTMAAMCIDDYVRTIVFLRGISSAIEEINDLNPGRPAEVLYAGSGPYGTLAVPLMAVFDSKKVKFTVLDIHRESVLSVTELIGNLGFSQSVREIAEVDALDYEVSPAAPPDIIVHETMKACLENEAQVAMVRRLSGQVPEALIIPEEIRVELKLVDCAKEFVISTDDVKLERDRIDLGSAFVVSKEEIHLWRDAGPDEPLPGGILPIPEDVEERYSLMLFTTIRVYRDAVLGDYDSGLTCPRVCALPKSEESGGALKFTYVTGSDPRLECRWVKVAGEG